MSIFKKVFQQSKSFAVLIDPDKTNSSQAFALLKEVNSIPEVSCILVGGSLVADNDTAEVIHILRSNTQKPVILFPGNINQICEADAILFLSLISGRNPEYLIGQHIVGAPIIKRLGMESISTGYMLIGEPSSTSYVSNTTPLPDNKPDIASATALAGEMMGHKVIYMDGGSGTKTPISENLIRSVANTISIPLIIGGGIRSYEEAKRALDSGAQLIVIGNAAEKDPQVLYEVANAVADVNRKLEVH